MAEGDSVALDIVVGGIDLRFASPPPPLLMACPPHLVTTGFQLEVLLGLVPDWLEKRYVVEFHRPVPLHFSRMFSVPRPDRSDRRPIIDLSPLTLYGIKSVIVQLRFGRPTGRTKIFTKILLT